MKFYLRNDIELLIKYTYHYTDEMAQFAKSHQDELFEFDQCAACFIIRQKYYISPPSIGFDFPSNHWHRDWLMNEKEKEKETEKEVEKTGQLLLNFG